MERGRIQVDDRRAETGQSRGAKGAGIYRKLPSRQQRATMFEVAAPAALARQVTSAERALARSPVSLSQAPETVPPRPGLYAIYGSAATWRQLGLGKPLDKRPLYVGKAEDSLVGRDLRTHFADGRTGQSTV